ncbi:MAG: tetratricopeptide repeat protein [Rubrobacteraceae bacterium]|jgi:cytochrome c-type biogenesis protein CcmH/NrfG|nr:tetratricopeptide repeat protein [Rubrobacter sp.]
MMMNRDKLGFWARFIAIGLAVVFIASFVFMGIGSNVTYNVFDMIGGENQQAAQQQGGGPEEQISAAEAELEENPEDPDAIKTLGGLYLQNGQLENAEEVLSDGREAAPEDEDMPVLLGQVYSQRALGAGEDGSEELHRQAGEEYVAATEIDPENSDAFLLAGQEYEEAGDSGRAIQYWNGYLDLEPDGEQSDAVRERVDALLEGGEEGGEGEEGGAGQGGGEVVEETPEGGSN